MARCVVTSVLLPAWSDHAQPASWALAPAAVWGRAPLQTTRWALRSSRGTEEKGAGMAGMSPSLSSNQGFLVPHAPPPPLPRPPLDNLCLSDSPEEKEEGTVAGLKSRREKT